MRNLKRSASLLLVLAAVAGVAACGGDDDETTATTTTTEAPAREEAGDDKGGQAANGERGSVKTIIVRDGEPVGGIVELEYDAGEQVRFRVNSIVADEVHVHGYDVSKEIPAGGTVELSFPADIEGIFEVELHESEKQIAELRVNP